MLINKAKRAEQNLKNLPFLPLQAEQVEFLFSPLEFKAQIIELIRQAKKAEKLKTDSAYKRLGKSVFKYMKIQDNNDPEYVTTKKHE